MVSLPFPTANLRHGLQFAPDGKPKRKCFQHEDEWKGKILLIHHFIHPMKRNVNAKQATYETLDGTGVYLIR